MKKTLATFGLLLILIALLAGCQKGDVGKNSATEVRIGYFPNITHAQAIVGIKKGFFQDALATKTGIDSKTFNAGPEQIEALFADEIDIGYVGPNPAINGYIKSDGEALRIIAGATSGGAAFVVRKDAEINSAKDLAGKKLASPQLGNTQDVALRNYLVKNGLQTKDKGGEVEVLEVKNPDILTLFQKNELDGAWVPEPWTSRLVKEGNGKILLDERDLWPNGEFVTANVVVRKEFLEQNPVLVKKFLAAHIAGTEWINENKEEAKSILNDGIKEITGKSLPNDVLDSAFARLEVTYDPVKSSLFKSADAAYALGFIKSRDLDDIYDLAPLNKVLSQKGLDSIK